MESLLRLEFSLFLENQADVVGNLKRRIGDDINFENSIINSKMDEICAVCGSISNVWWMIGSPKRGAEFCERVIGLGALKNAQMTPWFRFLLIRIHFAAAINYYSFAAYPQAISHFGSADEHLEFLKKSEEGTAGTHILSSIVYDGVGRCFREMGQLDRAQKLHEDGLAELDAIGSLQTPSWGFYEQMYNTLLPSADAQTEFPLIPISTAVTIYRGLGISDLGVVFYRKHMLSEAITCHEKALALRRQIGDLRGISSSIGNLAVIKREQGHWEESLQLYKDSLAIREQLHDTWGIAGSLSCIGILSGLLGHHRVGLESLLKALNIFYPIVHDQLGVAECAESVAIILSKAASATATTEATEHRIYLFKLAAKFFGAAVGTRKRIGAASLHESDALRQSHQAVCDALSAPVMEMLRVEGGEWSCETVILEVENAIKLL